MFKAASLMNRLSNQPTVVHILNGLQFGGNETLCLQLSFANAPKDVHNILLILNPDHQENATPLSANSRIIYRF